MAVYDKDKRFSPGWMIGGAVLMFITNAFGSFVFLGAGSTSFWGLVAIRMVCFAFTGFVIGWQSEGQTILEAGLAAVISIAVAVGTQGLAALALLAPVVLMVGLGAPFLAAVLGAWIGEKVQGDTIETED